MRLLRRVFLGILIVFVLLVMGASIAAYFYKEQASEQVLTRLRQNLKTDIDLDPYNVSLDFFTKPGYLALTFKNMEVLGKGEQSVEPLARIGRSIFVFDWQELFSQRYQIQKIYFEKVSLNFLVNFKGASNYAEVFDFEAKSEGNGVDLSLAQIFVKNLRFKYENKRSAEDYQFLLNRLQLNFAEQLDGMAINLSEVSLSDINLQNEGQLLFNQPSLKISQTQVFYKTAEQKITLPSTTFSLQKSKFSAEGSYQSQAKRADLIDVKIKGNNQDLRSLVTFLPQKWYERFVDFKTEKGKITFEGEIKGRWSSQQFPKVEFRFASEGVSIRSPHDIRQNIENLRFEGVFSNGAKRNLETSSLRVKNLSGSLVGKKMRGDFYLLNFKAPYVVSNFEAGIDLAAWHDFLPMPEIQTIKGLLGLKLSFDGAVKALADELSADKIQASGNVELIDVNFKLKQNPVGFRDVNLRLKLNNNEAEIREATALFGKSDFRLKGEVSNLFGYFLLPKIKLKINGDYYARQLDLEQVLRSLVPSSKPDKSLEQPSYAFILPEGISANLQCRIDSLHFRRLRPTGLKGQIQLDEQVLKTSRLDMAMAQGKISLIGILNAQKPNHLSCDGRALFQQNNVEQVFYLLENFGQEFLSHKNLSGKLFADVLYSISFDRYLRFYPSGLLADINATVKQGKFTGFEPFQRLDSRLQKEGYIENPSFAELKTIVQIRNKSLYVPEFELRNASNTFAFSAIGRSTHDKGLEYRLRTVVKPRTVNPLAQNSYIKGKNGFATFFLNLEGSYENPEVKFTYSPNRTIQTGEIAQNWIKEKRAYMSLFNKNSLSKAQFRIPEGYFPQ